MRWIGLLAVAVVVAVPSPAAAETFNVTGTADVTGTCEGSSCPSIRAALATAQRSPGADTILIPAGDYQLTQGELTVDTSVTIRGAGARLTTIIGDAQLLARVFDVGAVTATFTRLTMRGGTAGSHNEFWGGNLRNNGGNVLLDHLRVTDGSASSGGGVGNIAGTMTIQHSLIDGNRAVTNGGDSGGIQNFGSETTPGVLTVRDSTVAFNTARLAGGILSWGSNPRNVTTLERVTVAYNTGGDRGTGGIGRSFASETFQVRASIVANNTVDGTPSNCGGVLPTSDGGNVVSNDDCAFTAAGDVQNADPLLSAALVNAGGETDLLTIDGLSPARNRVGGCLGADQRDLSRPQAGACDAGAYEIDEVPDTSLTVTPRPGTAPTFAFSSSEPGVRFECRLDGPAGAGAFAPCTAPTTYDGLAPGAYTFYVRAIDGGGAADPTPESAGFGIQRAQLPPPEPGKTVNALPESGTVKIKLPGSKRFVELDEGQQIPMGTVVDTRNGRVELVAASNRSGGTATADFYDGLFRISQSKGAKPITTLKLTEKLSCPTGKKATTAAKRKKKRRLWGDGSGRFRTEGEYSSATVRGTKWLVDDRCTSTLTRVVRGKVSVRDFVKKKTVIVRKGKRYIARAK